MSLATDLREFLLTDVTITEHTSNRIHHVKMPQLSSYPAIWFGQSSEEEPAFMDGAGELKRKTFDLEVLTTAVGTQSELSLKVRIKLHGHRGQMGQSDVQGVFVEDKDASYEFRNNAADEGIAQSAMSVMIWST